MNSKHWFLLVAVALVFSFCKPSKKTPDAASAAANSNPTIAELTALLEKNPQNDSLLFLRGQAYYNDDSYDPAINDVAAALQIDSTKPPYFHLLADIFLDYYKSHEALRIMEVAAARFPTRIPTLLKLSEFQLILKKHTEALQTIDKIFRQDPQNAEAWFMTGQICKDMGQLDRAVVSYKKCVALNPNERDAYISLGQIYTSRKDKLALSYFNNALRIDSSSLETRHAIANYYEQTGDLKQAIAIYREIIDHDATYAEAYFNTGLLYLDLDSVEKAKQHFELTIKTDPLYIKAYYFRGVAEEKLGNPTAALADFEQAVRMAPGYKEAQEAADRLKRK